MPFRGELEALINIYNQEAASNTPDFILAQYMESCLTAFDTAVQQRETWYGRDASPAEPERHHRGRAPRGWWHDKVQLAMDNPGTEVVVDINDNRLWTDDKAGRNLASSWACEMRDGGPDGNTHGFTAVYSGEGPRVVIAFDNQYHATQGRKPMRLQQG